MFYVNFLKNAHPVVSGLCGEHSINKADVSPSDGLGNNVNFLGYC